MITVTEAIEIILDSALDFGIEEVDLKHSALRILREDIYCDRDLPPYDRVTMDGIAIKFKEFESGSRSFAIAGIAGAGAAQQVHRESISCREVMTGSTLPEGLDTVVRYEDLEIGEGVAKILTDDIKFRQNIHFEGQDQKKGDLVLSAGTLISPAEIGVCASVGKSRVNVSRLPKTLIVSTGNELIDIEESPLPHQIRKSNSHQLSASLKQWGIEADLAHLKDDLSEVKHSLKNYLEQYEVILLSGGVSMGKFDYLPKALDVLGVNRLFHKILQRPGKPFWFGKYGDRCTIFAFPGNPVSSFACLYRYFIPWMNKSSKLQKEGIAYAKLSEEVIFKPDLTYFLQVKLNYSEFGEIWARPETGNGSGDLANLLRADAFMELPAGKDCFKQGEAYPIYPFRTTLH